MDTLNNIYTRHEQLATRTNKRTPKIPYRSYAECEADGYAKGARDAILISVAVITLIVAAFLGERIFFGAPIC